MHFHMWERIQFWIVGACLLVSSRRLRGYTMGGMQNETKFVQNVSSSIGEKGTFSQVTDTLGWLFFDFYIRLLCKRFIMLTFGLPPFFKACSWCHTPPPNKCGRPNAAGCPLLPPSSYEFLCATCTATEPSIHVSFPLSSDPFVCAVVLPLFFSHAPPPVVNYLIIQLINAISNECEWIAIRIRPFSGWRRVRAPSQEKAHGRAVAVTRVACDPFLS